jgi:probable HAF family extracellular repeat protein
LFVLTALVLGAGQVFATASYYLTDLGTLGGTYATAYAVNNAGQVTGLAGTPGNQGFHAFVWENGAMRDLGTLGSTRSCGTDINDSGQVVGYSYLLGENMCHGFYMQGDDMVDIAPLPAGYSDLHAINNDAQMAGTGPGVGAVLWDHGVPTALPSLGGSGSAAVGMNDNGWVVGQAIRSDGKTHAALWHDGGVEDLGTLGGPWSGANAVNDSGQVVGASYVAGDPNYNFHACLWENGTITDLGGWDSIARDINESGQIVGKAYWNACLWESGEMSLLTMSNVVGPTEGYWNFIEARGINDRGQIVGYGWLDGNERAFLLTPAPGLPAFALLGAVPVVGGLVRRLRRR